MNELDDNCNKFDRVHVGLHEVIDSLRRTLRAVGAFTVHNTGRRQVPENVPALTHLIGQHLLELHSLALYGSGVTDPTYILKPAVRAAVEVLVSTAVDPSRFMPLQVPNGIFRYRLELKEVPNDVGRTTVAATIDVAALRRWPGEKWQITKTRQVVAGLGGTAIMHGIAIVNANVDVSASEVMDA